MRLTAVAAALLLSVSTIMLSTQAVAQDRVPVETRVGTLEKQMRSVQRKVFQPGSAGAVEADLPAPPAPVNNTVSDLTSRVDALERQLAVITGQVEENGNRLRTFEDQSNRARADFEARVGRLEGGAVQAAAPSPPPAAQVEEAPTAVPSDEPQAPAPSEPDPVSTDPAENAYLAGFRLWEARRYDEAATTLAPIGKTWAKHRRASWARNLLGRAYLDDNKPATAAEAFLANYQELPQGERAADSLYFLGQALMKLNKPEQACKVYDELNDVYGSSMRDFLKTNLPAARKTAKCRG